MYQKIRTEKKGIICLGLTQILVNQAVIH